MTIMTSMTKGGASSPSQQQPKRDAVAQYTDEAQKRLATVETPVDRLARRWRIGRLARGRGPHRLPAVSRGMRARRTGLAMRRLATVGRSGTAWAASPFDTRRQLPQKL